MKCKTLNSAGQSHSHRQIFEMLRDKIVRPLRKYSMAYQYTHTPNVKINRANSMKTAPHQTKLRFLQFTILCPCPGPQAPTLLAGLRRLALLLLYRLDVEPQQLFGLPLLLLAIQGPLQVLLEVCSLVLCEVQSGSQLCTRDVHQGLGRKGVGRVTSTGAVTLGDVVRK